MFGERAKFCILVVMWWVFEMEGVGLVFFLVFIWCVRIFFTYRDKFFPFSSKGRKARRACFMGQSVLESTDVE